MASSCEARRGFESLSLYHVQQVRMMKEKQCSKCKKHKPVSEFGKRSDRPDGLVSACKECLRKDMAEKRKQFKIKCVEYLGGCCSSCGYNKCLAALEFHHNIPSEKDFVVNTGKTRNFTEEVKKELDKCSLLCANCHREEHVRLNSLSY